MEYKKRIFSHKLLLNDYFNYKFYPPFEGGVAPPQRGQGG